MIIIARGTCPNVLLYPTVQLHLGMPSFGDLRCTVKESEKYCEDL